MMLKVEFRTRYTSQQIFNALSQKCSGHNLCRASVAEGCRVPCVGEGPELLLDIRSSSKRCTERLLKEWQLEMRYGQEGHHREWLCPWRSVATGPSHQGRDSLRDCGQPTMGQRSRGKPAKSSGKKSLDIQPFCYACHLTEGTEMDWVQSSKNRKLE